MAIGKTQPGSSLLCTDGGLFFELCMTSTLFRTILVMHLQPPFAIFCTSLDAILWLLSDIQGSWWSFHSMESRFRLLPVCDFVVPNVCCLTSVSMQCGAFKKKMTLRQQSKKHAIHYKKYKFYWKAAIISHLKVSWLQDIFWVIPIIQWMICVLYKDSFVFNRLQSPMFTV